MPRIRIRIRIPAPKNQNNEALRRFLSIYPNNTADEGHVDFIAPNGLTDEEWMEERTRRWVNEIINTGALREHEAKRPADDDSVVERDPERNGQ